MSHNSFERVVIILYSIHNKCVLQYYKTLLYNDRNLTIKIVTGYKKTV